MYNTSIIMLISWPVLIIVSWLAVRFALYLYEKRLRKIERMMQE